MIDVIKSKYRQCGTFQCGEVNELWKNLLTKQQNQMERI
jgi:hypothetical protein